jgi:hypothetical protein
LRFDSQWGLGIFLFNTVSRTALGPTQPPVQWVLGVLSLGVKQAEREADHSPPSSAKVKECVFMAWCIVKHRDLTFYHHDEMLFSIVNIIHNDLSRKFC